MRGIPRTSHAQNRLPMKQWMGKSIDFLWSILFGGRFSSSCTICREQKMPQWPRISLSVDVLNEMPLCHRSPTISKVCKASSLFVAILHQLPSLVVYFLSLKLSPNWKTRDGKTFSSCSLGGDGAIRQVWVLSFIWSVNSSCHHFWVNHSNSTNLKKK